MIENIKDELIEKARQYMAVSTFDHELILDGSTGCSVWEYSDSNRCFLDWASGPGVANIGWNHPELIHNVCVFLKSHKSGYGGNEFLNPYVIQLAEKICKITPGNFGKKVFFSNSGGEAVEAGIIACLLRRPERKRVLSFINGFHGRMGYSRVATTSKEVHFLNLPQGVERVSNLIFPAENSENPAHKRLMLKLANPQDYMDYVECQIGKFVNDINVVVLELIQGEGGVNVAHKEHMQLLVKYLREHGVLILVDEVQTGFGRTGKMWACDHYKIEPDIMTLAKASSGGLVPIGLTIMRDEVSYKYLREHSNTHGGNPLASFITLKVLEIIEKEELVAHAAVMGRYLRQKLDQEFWLNDNATNIVDIGSINGLGLMQRISLVHEHGKTDHCSPDPEARDLVVTEAQKNEMLLMGAGTSSIRLMPPLIISREQIDDGIAVIKKSVADVAIDLKSRFFAACEC